MRPCKAINGVRLWEGTLDEFRKEHPGYMGRIRFQVFTQKGLSCVTCGLEGTRVVMWKQTNPGASSGTHADLVAYRGNREVMITLDHHLPRSYGGRTTVENLNPMCSPCNARKNNTIPTQAIEGLIAFMTGASNG